MKNPLELSFEPKKIVALLSNEEAQKQITSMIKGVKQLVRNLGANVPELPDIVSELQILINNLDCKQTTLDTKHNCSLGYSLGADIKMNLDQIGVLLNQREFYKAVFKLILDKFETTTKHNYESILPYTHSYKSKELLAYREGIQELNEFIFNTDITAPAIKEVFEIEDYLTLLKIQLPEGYTTGILTIQEDPLRIVIEGPVSPKPNGGFMVPKHICLAQVNVPPGYIGSISIPADACVKQLVDRHQAMVHFADPAGRMACQFS
jgi:hypothetical protein